MNKELTDIAKNLAEVGIDTCLSEGLIKDIPVVSTLVGLAKYAKSIPDLIFASKINKFLSTLSNIEQQKKDDFFNEVNEDKEKLNKAGQIIIFNLDSANCLKKAEILGLLFKAYINGKIKFEIFDKMCNVVNFADTNDLITLIYAVKEDKLWQNPYYGHLKHTDFIETKYSVNIDNDEGFLIHQSYTPTITAINFGELCKEAIQQSN